MHPRLKMICLIFLLLFVFLIAGTIYAVSRLPPPPPLEDREPRERRPIDIVLEQQQTHQLLFDD